MKKQYITKGYIKDLTDKEKATGVFFSSPKVVVKGDKYRDVLKPIEKLVYEELYDMTRKAAHINQVDKNGNVYVEVSYIFLAVALGVSDSTIQRILSKETNPLYALGLLTIKERKDKSTTQYYVMAPVYEGDDKVFLTQDAPTPKMLAKAKELVARKNRTSSKRETENKQLAEQRKLDTVEDTAHYDVVKREEANNTPDGIELKQEQVPEQQKELIIVEKYVEERSSITGYHSIILVEKMSDDSVKETDLKKKFPKSTDSKILGYAQKHYEVKQVEMMI
ncbi:hypothetical protein ACLHWY_17650 [Priestia aryabhattai]|uniref:hypothetical protein n=1 Tax=Priestia aryabhattai TaxID=412384 RepID=UPI003982F9A8